ncbi:MAG: class I SAM-dependent methyltransferase [Bacteroidota bacterium]
MAKDYWESLSSSITKPGDTKNKRPDTSDLEIDFLKNYISAASSVLDLGAGSGLITNKLVPFVGEIIAVERYEGFSRFIVDDPKIMVINAQLEEFKVRRQFDLILLTGVAQCFKKEVMAGIYQNIGEMLGPNSYFISRMHCGLQEDVIVDGWSEELQTDYFAEYRQLDKEIELIKASGMSKVETFDFLPDTINVWENTRHFYFVCKA